MKKNNRNRFMITVSYLRGVIPISKEILFLSKKAILDENDLSKLRESIAVSESMPGIEVAPTSIKIENIYKR